MITIRAVDPDPHGVEPGSGKLTLIRVTKVALIYFFMLSEFINLLQIIYLYNHTKNKN